eukprot:6148711-Prymnesium_polylepis.1
MTPSPFHTRHYPVGPVGGWSARARSSEHRAMKSARQAKSNHNQSRCSQTNKPTPALRTARAQPSVNELSSE